MGFQQLLLLTLSLIIVMLSVAIGIDAFHENKQRFEADNLVNDAVHLAAEAQAWYVKPALNGGGNNTSWQGISFAHMGYHITDEGYYHNRNGTFRLDAKPNVLFIVGVDSSAGVTVSAQIDGLRADDIEVDIDRWGTLPFRSR